MFDDTPALLGGPPVCPDGPPPWPVADQRVADAIHAVVADGSWGQYLGPGVERLERLLADVHGVPHAVTCATGTLAVEVAFRAAGVGQGDEVVLGAYDFEPSFLSVHQLGARPVLVDVSSDHAGLTASTLEAAITPQTRAILATHLHGGLVRMSAVMEVARRHSVAVVEDAAQATGATVEGRPAGTWGDLGVLSFGGSKLLTAGRGGSLLTRRADLLQRVRLVLGRGVQQWAPLSELQAAALVPQVEWLANRTGWRTRLAARLLGGVADLPGLRPFGPAPPDSQPAYYKLGFFYNDAAFGLPRDLFVKALRAEGVAFDSGFRALHVGRAPTRYRAVGPLANAEAAGRTVVTLHHPVLSVGDMAVEQVADALWKTYRNAARIRGISGSP